MDSIMSYSVQSEEFSVHQSTAIRQPAAAGHQPLHELWDRYTSMLSTSDMQWQCCTRTAATDNEERMPTKKNNDINSEVF